jgi:DNA modification methylase
MPIFQYGASERKEHHSMSEITTVNNSLPTTIEDLSKFVLIGREKLVAVRAEIRAIQKVGLAQEVREQKLAEAQEIAEAVLDAEVRIGELMAKVPKASHDRGNQYTGGKSTLVSGSQTKTEVIKAAGFTPKQVERFETLAKHPEIVEQAKAEARENDDVVSRSLALNMIRSQKKADEIEQARTQIEEQQKQNGDAVIFVGDCIGRKLKNKCDLLLTDPPYSTDVENVEEFADSWLYNALDNVKDTGFGYVFIGAYPDELKAYLNARIPEHMSLVQVLVWTYKNTLGQNPKDRYKLNWQACLFYRGVNAPALDCPLTNEQWAVQEINAPDGRQGDRYHAWQKPLEIGERFVRHTTKPGDTVFDPFACTGTFLIAASKLGRKGIGFEIDPDNARIAEQRGVRLCRIE